MGCPFECFTNTPIKQAPIQIVLPCTSWGGGGGGEREGEKKGGSKGETGGEREGEKEGEKEGGSICVCRHEMKKNGECWLSSPMSERPRGHILAAAVLS